MNASSLSMPYTAPLASATITTASHNSSIKYVYGNCANATALSTAYTTISSHNTIILSTIAPSATCCTKCEIGADMVCYGVARLISGAKGFQCLFRQSPCSRICFQRGMLTSCCRFDWSTGSPILRIPPRIPKLHRIHSCLITIHCKYDWDARPGQDTVDQVIQTLNEATDTDIN